MRIICCFVIIITILGFSSNLEAQGYCIKYKNNRLSVKATSKTSCPSGQAFIPTIAGATGPQGETGPQGATGTQGIAGTNGSARAYGFVSSTGSLNTAKSTSTAAARKVATGIYCISASGIDPSTVMPLVSADQDDGNGSFHLAQLKSQFGSVFGCTASEWAVHTSQFSAGSFTATDIAFSFLIP